MKYSFFKTAVIDTDNYIYYSTSEFKKTIQQKILDEFSHQKSINDSITAGKEVWPYSLNEATLGFLEACLATSEREVQQLQKFLYRTTVGPSDFMGSIAQAKEIPVTDYLEFDSGGFVKCLWHQEKTPSLKYYPKTNSVHCFSCDRSGDVLDVVRQLYNLDLNGAVRFVLKQ